MGKSFTYVSFFKLIVFLLAFSFSYTLRSQSQILILPGATYLTNFGDQIDNIKLVGNARFKHDNTYMECDTAYIYNKSQTVNAVGRVKLTQGSSWTLYGNELKYYGQTKTAFITGNVRLVENDMTLTCDAIELDIRNDVAKYQNGGKVVSSKNENTLTSIKGFYYSKAKKMTFTNDVVLTNKDYVIKSDNLDYIEETGITYFNGKTTITGDSTFIFCKNGNYDTKNDIANFNKDAYIISNKVKLQGDSLYYDKKRGYAKAINHVIITDTANKVIVNSNLGEHYQKTKTSYFSRNPIVKRWFEKDTMYLRADTINIVNDSAKKENTILAYPNVRFYKADVQGSCDSLIYTGKDSLISMFFDPVVWSDKSQLTGDTIRIQIGNKTLQKIDLLQNAFITEQVVEIKYKDSLKEEADSLLTDYYNQIKGKTIRGIFQDDTIRKILVDGNGQSVYYTNEPGEPIQAFNKIACSNLVMTFANNKVNDILFLKKPKGTLFPIEEKNKEEEKLEGFVWNTNKPNEKDFNSIK